MKGAYALLTLPALFAVLGLISTEALAHTACLQGDYQDAHGKLILQVQAHHHEATLQEVGSGAHYTVRMLGAAAKRELWQQQGWAVAAMKGAECGADASRQHVVCMLSLPGGEPVAAARGFNSVYVAPDHAVRWLHLQ